MRLQSYHYKNILLVTLIFFTANMLCFPAIAFSDDSASNSKKDYFLKKIIKNEIDALKKELTDKEEQYKKHNQSYTTFAEIKNQNNGVEKLKQEIQSLQASLNQATLNNEKSASTTDEALKKELSTKDKQIEILQNKLAQKGNMLESVSLGNNQELEDNQLLEALSTKDKQIEILRRQLSKQDDKYMQLLSEKKIELDTVEAEIKRIKKQRKDAESNLARKEDIISLQENTMVETKKQIRELKEKNNGFISEIVELEKKEIQAQIIAGENIELKAQHEILNKQLTEIKEGYEAKIIEKQKLIEELRSTGETDVSNTSNEWRQKIKMNEDKYFNQIKSLEKDIVLIKDQNSKQLRDLTVTVRISEDERKQLKKDFTRCTEALEKERKGKRGEVSGVEEAWKQKLEWVEKGYVGRISELEQQLDTAQKHRQNRIGESDDILFSHKKKGKKLQLDLDTVKKENKQLKKQLKESKRKQKQVKPKILYRKFDVIKGVAPIKNSKPKFKGKNKDKAKDGFDRAMQAIVDKDYATAKYQLEKVLEIQPGNKMTVDVLGDVNLILENKKSN